MIFTPPFLDDDAKKLFKKLEKDIPSQRHTLLAAYCQAWAELTSATNELKVSGRFVTLPNGCMMQHPASKIQKQALSSMSILASKLELDRSTETPEDDNPIAKLIHDADVRSTHDQIKRAAMQKYENK